MDALSDPRAFLSAQEKRAEQLKAIGVGDDDISTNDVIVTKKATSNSGKSAGSGGPQPPSMGYPPGLPPKKTVEKGSGTRIAKFRLSRITFLPKSAVFTSSPIAKGDCNFRYVKFPMFPVRVFESHQS